MPFRLNEALIAIREFTWITAWTPSVQADSFLQVHSFAGLPLACSKLLVRLPHQEVTVSLCCRETMQRNASRRPATLDCQRTIRRTIRLKSRQARMFHNINIRCASSYYDHSCHGNQCDYADTIVWPVIRKGPVLKEDYRLGFTPSSSAGCSLSTCSIVQNPSFTISSIVSLAALI